VKASGPITGNSRCLPNVMLSPVSASMTNDVALSQWQKRSNGVYRNTLMPERPADMRSGPMIR
jgi:hypothetical protein